MALAVDVFEISVAEGYERIQGVDRPGREVLSGLDGTVRRRSWTPIDVCLITMTDEARDARLFRIPQLGEVFATDSLVERVDEHGCRD